MKPDAKPNLKNPIHLLAFGFGSGLSPKMPGTVGTLAALPFYALLVQMPLSLYLVITLFCAVVGIYLCGRTARDLGVHDHGGIVWDEFVGYFITMILVPPSLITVTLGFALFRLFDIAKPWPIRWVDKRVSGGLGIMLDDILAGLLAAAVLHILLHFFPVLLATI